jgi:hypothetical protein
VEEREGRAGPGDATHQAKVDPPPTEGGGGHAKAEARAERRHRWREESCDGAGDPRQAEGRHREIHGGEHGGCTGWGDDMRGEGGGGRRREGRAKRLVRGRVRVRVLGGEVGWWEGFL